MEPGKNLKKCANIASYLHFLVYPGTNLAIFWCQISRVLSIFTLRIGRFLPTDQLDTYTSRGVQFVRQIKVQLDNFGGFKSHLSRLIKDVSKLKLSL